MRQRKKRDLTHYLNIKEEFTNCYCVKFMKVADIAKHFNIPVKRVYSLIKFFGLTRDGQKVKSISLSKSESKNKLFLEVKKRISKEDITKWYIDEDHDYKEASKHFGITQSMFDKICNEYNIKKDRSKARQKSIKRFEDKHGREGWSLINKQRKQTIIDKYGSLESFYNQRQATIEQHNIKQYGFKHPATAKMFDNHSNLYGKCWGSKEESIKYFENLGYKPTIEELMTNLKASINCIYLWIEKWDLGSYCSFVKTKQEQSVVDWLQNLGCNIIRGDRKILNGLELDIYLPDYKVAIEFNGNYWHSDNQKQNKQYHFNKSYACEQKGIRLIHIYQYQWENPIKQNILKSIILNALGKNNNIIYARKCKVKELKKKDVQEFSELNSLHGHRNAKIYLGLFYDDELVEIMTFGKAFFARDKSIDYECIRSITKLNTTVIGGMNKLFKYFINQYNPNKILYYIDYNTHNGTSMSKLGFKFDSYSKYGMVNIANCKEVREKYGLVFNRKPDKNKEINQYVKEGKVLTIYDAGVKRYFWTNPQ